MQIQIPWDKLSSIPTGIIRPLREEGSEPEIVIEITGESAKGFSRRVLDTKIKEALKQIGAEVEKWKERS